MHNQTPPNFSVMFLLLCMIIFKGNAFDGNILHRLIVFICFCRRDGIHHIQTLKDLPENGIGIAENIFQMCRAAEAHRGTAD